jgi:hypothetical protein
MEILSIVNRMPIRLLILITGRSEKWHNHIMVHTSRLGQDYIKIGCLEMLNMFNQIKEVRSALLCDFIQRRVRITYRRFGTNYRPPLQWSRRQKLLGP